MPENAASLPDFTRWPSFPFEGDMRVKDLAAPVAVEPPRSGEDASDCVACNTPDDAYIWENERWRVRAMDRPTGLPMVLILECRSHLDMGDLPNLLAAELGVMTVRLERAIRSLDGVARVHVNRWGDGSAHLHMWFLARPYGRLQLRGTFLSLWDDILPTIPEDQWRENLALVAAWLAEFGGHANTEPAHIQWQSPSTFSVAPQASGSGAEYASTFSAEPTNANADGDAVPSDADLGAPDAGDGSAAIPATDISGGSAVSLGTDTDSGSPASTGVNRDGGSSASPGPNADGGSAATAASEVGAGPADGPANSVPDVGGWPADSAADPVARDEGTDAGSPSAAGASPGSGSRSADFNSAGGAVQRGDDLGGPATDAGSGAAGRPSNGSSVTATETGSGSDQRDSAAADGAVSGDSQSGDGSSSANADASDSSQGVPARNEDNDQDEAAGAEKGPWRPSDLGEAERPTPANGANANRASA